MASRLVAAFAAIAIMSTSTPALAAPLVCQDPAVVAFVNNSLKGAATFGDTGKSANSKGPLKIVGIPRSMSSSKSALVCHVRVRHIDPTNGASETLSARLTVRLNRDGSIADASMRFLEGSQ